MIPTQAGPDTICECGHWHEEHGPGVCHAPGCPCSGFAFDADASAPDAIADRGGDPEFWPQWVKDHYGPERMAEWTR